MKSSSIPIRRSSFPFNVHSIDNERDLETIGSIHDFGVPVMFDDLPFFDDFEYISSSFKFSQNSPFEFNPGDEVNTLESILNSPMYSRKIWRNMDKILEKDSIRLHRDSITSICMSSDQKLFTVSHDSHLKIYSLRDQKLLRSTQISNLALSSCILTDDQKHAVIGSWDNHVYMYSVEYGKITNKLSGHDDAVSSMVMKKDNLLTGSWDSTVKLWKLNASGFEPEPLCDFTNLESEVKSVDMNSDATMCVSGSGDGLITLMDLRMEKSAKSWKIHTGPVSSVNFMEGGRIISTGTDGMINAIDLDGKTLSNVETMMMPINASCTNGYRMLITGQSNEIELWDIARKNQLKKFKKEGAYVNCIIVDQELGLVLTGSTDGYVTFWKNDFMAEQ